MRYVLKWSHPRVRANYFMGYNYSIDGSLLLHRTVFLAEAATFDVKDNAYFFILDKKINDKSLSVYEVLDEEWQIAEKELFKAKLEGTFVSTKSKNLLILGG